jgi:hypothetical protein
MASAACSVSAFIVVLKPEAVVEPVLKFGIPFIEHLQPGPQLVIFLACQKKSFLTGLVNTDFIFTYGRARALVTAPAAVQSV